MAVRWFVLAKCSEVSMKSTRIPEGEAAHLIQWCRTEDILVGTPGELYFHMLYSGRYVCRKTFFVQRRNLPSVLLLLTLEGAGRLRYRGRTYELLPGSAMLIHTWEAHEYEAVEEGWTFQYLHFSGAMSQSYLEYLDARFGPVFPLRRDVFLETQKRLTSIYRETEKNTALDYAVLSLEIYAILTSFLSVKNAVEPVRKSAEAVYRAADYIAEHYSRPLTVRQIADAVYLSRSYMSELFSQTYGVSPHAYLTMYRLSHVKELLHNTGLSLAQIAQQCGFRDAFILSRVFKRETGMSPSEYRKWVQE